MKCLPNVDRVGQICVTAVDGMNVPQLADQKPNFAILVIFIRVILWLFHCKIISTSEQDNDPLCLLTQSQPETEYKEQVK